jgi:hypothetical protein
MIEWIDDEERFAALEAEWDSLADIARSPFLRHAWVCAWWGAFGRGCWAGARAGSGHSRGTSHCAAAPLARFAYGRFVRPPLRDFARRVHGAHR